MVRRTDIDRYVANLAREFSPRQVVLFGSYANGHATDESDVDLLVIMDKVTDGAEQALEMRRRIPRSFPLDLLVFSKREATRRLAEQDTFFKSIMRDGQTVYEDQR